MILLAWEADTKVVASSAARNLMSIGWAWFVLENYPIVGWLYVRPLVPSDGVGAFTEQISDYNQAHFNITTPANAIDLTYSAALHDAIMLYAHAATKVLSEGGDLRDGHTVTQAVRSTTFEGVGKIMVALDKQGDRIESYEVMNYVAKVDGGISSVPVGMYDHKLQQYRAYEQAVRWPGNSTEVPADYFSGAIRLHCCAPLGFNGTLLECPSGMQRWFEFVHVLCLQRSRSTSLC